MKSLREEITNELVDLTVFTGTNRTTKELGDRIENGVEIILSKIEKKLDERIDRLLKIKEPVPDQILLKCAGLEEAKMILTNNKDKK